MTQRLPLLVLFVALNAALVWGAPQMSGDKSEAAKTITGCLQKGTESEGYFLIDKAGKHWELYSAPDVSLADHVGHTVAVTGTVAHRTKDQEAVSQPNEKKETGTRKHADFQVTSMKHVADTCSK